MSVLMPEFLVRIAVAMPADLDPAKRADLVAAERQLGRRLIDDGSIVRIWRIPGTANNVGVWRAADASDLHALLRSLPLAAWCTIEVTALAVHPLEGGAEA
jgi:muconolactone D-isomerase